MLAHLTPLPPERTGVADANARLLKELGRHTGVTAYVRGRAEPLEGVRVRRARGWNLRRLGRHDAVVAQIGNSASHEWILREVRRRRMIVELHDLVLHHLIAHMHFNPRRGEPYEEAMAREAGTLGRLVARGALAGDLPSPWVVAPQRFPLTGEAVRNAERVIVHSHHAARTIRERYPAVPVHVVPLLTERPASSGGPERPAGDHRPVVACFGFVTAEKRIDLAVAALRRVRARLPNAHLLIVGQVAGGVDPHAAAEAAGLPADALTVVGFASHERFAALMAGTDIGLNLRQPTMGETSATAIQLAALGVPTIVSEGGWYDEIPDAAVRRLAHGEGETERLADLILELAEDERAHAAAGEAARSWVEEALAPEVVAEAHVEATLGVGARREIQRSLVRHVGEHLAQISDSPGREASGVVMRVAAAGRELGVL